MLRCQRQQAQGIEYQADVSIFKYRAAGYAGQAFECFAKSFRDDALAFVELLCREDKGLPRCLAKQRCATGFGIRWPRMAE